MAATQKACPANHLDAYRAYFRKSDQEDVRHVSERYIVKSDPFIVMLPTPYTPDGFFDIIEKEPEVLLLSWNISLILRQAIGKVLKWWHQYNE